jgi:hypothetical protein
LIIINNDCDCLKIAVFKALHAAISAKEEAQSKRLVEAIELNKSFISHLVQSLHSCESLYSLKWNLISLLAVNFVSKNVQNFIFFETEFFSLLHNYLEGPMKELELHSYIVENIKSLCFSEQFLDKVSQTFSWVLLKNLFTNFNRFISEGFSKIILCYAQIFLLLKATSQMRSFLGDPLIFPQLMFSFLNVNCSLEIKVIFLKMMIICVNKEIHFKHYLDIKFILFNTGFFCKSVDKQDIISKMFGKSKISQSQHHFHHKFKENSELNFPSINKKNDSLIKKSFKLGLLLTDCFETAIEQHHSLAIERCLILFGHCFECKSIFSFLRQKTKLLESISEDFPNEVAFLQSKLKI